jgi:hypothetical protein
MVIGDVIGSAADPSDVVNRVFIPSTGRTMNLVPCGGRSNAAVGAIDVFDFTNQAQPLSQTILPPPRPGIDDEVDLPCDAGGFGHWIAIADVDGDDFNDLVVGAPNSDGNDDGRVYIFFGHELFMTESHYDSLTVYHYADRWMVLHPPQRQSPPTFALHGYFGASVAAADLDGDGKAEVIVGRPEKGNGPGRVHVFSGSWLTSQIYGESFIDLTPPSPETIDAGVEPYYQTLTDNATGDLAPAATSAGFGWIVGATGADLGSPLGESVGFDGKPDVLVHSEGAKGYEKTDQDVVDGGALFVFMDTADQSPADSWVDAEAPARLMTPRIKDAQNDPLYYPQSGARFGRSWTLANWQTTDGDPTEILVVAETDRDITDNGPPLRTLTSAGAVYAFELPLDPSFDPNENLDGPHLNAWGDFVLLEPSDGLAENSETPLDGANGMTPQLGAIWGGWMVAGKYDTLLPGDQIVISARERNVPSGGAHPYFGTGVVCALTLPSTSP